MSPADYSFLDGRIVLVKSSQDRRDPPTARRGTISVQRALTDQSPSRIIVAVEVPDMFTAPAHRREFELNAGQVDELLRSEAAGTHSVTLDFDFESDARDQSPVVPE